jgi:3-dehydroquinate dehydratase
METAPLPQIKTTYEQEHLCSLQELLSEILDVTKIACAPSSSIDAYRMLNSTARGKGNRSPNPLVIPVPSGYQRSME